MGDDTDRVLALLHVCAHDCDLEDRVDLSREADAMRQAIAEIEKLRAAAETSARKLAQTGFKIEKLRADDHAYVAGLLRADERFA